MYQNDEKDSPEEKNERTESSEPDSDETDSADDSHYKSQSEETDSQADNTTSEIYNGISQKNDVPDSDQEVSASETKDSDDQNDPVKAKDLFDPAPSYQNNEERKLPQRSLADKTLYAWRFGAVIEAIFFFIFSAAYWGASQFIALPMWGLYTLIAITLAWAVFYISIWQSLCWSRWKYQVYEDEVELMFGVVIKRRIIIPMIRVQHVDTRQGPVLRYLGLASVTISTAATVHEVPGLTIDNADRLRDQIAELAREADPDE